MLTAILAALALLVWPSFQPINRLRPRSPKRLPRIPLPALSILACPLGFGALIAVFILMWTVDRVAKTRAAQRIRLTSSEALITGLAGVVAELKAGAPAPRAATNAASDCPQPASDVLKAVAATANLGGDVNRTLHDLAPQHPHLALTQLARAWQVSTRYGVALAEVLDATRQDLAQRAAFARQLESRMAGPRASAAVLAALPLLGLLLGQASGAEPAHVLFATVPGQTLLVLGALLTAAGLLWTTGLTTKAAHT
ncbi:hypothetical protein Lesp02_51550 [Lentzea sp. NBRC 105346]|uniref:type II secretion system F family protein n=1 Tax=Lentzea sp. NBRC 105346 TaxID=3032205 RepID=UPI0024A5E814|nr:type II secretion system F family protein [Lentzea sp. NBRC 105346]GLZ32967.1 hypothetical protein Lesp02_51550 [Lentzea sp. NBRC 105346]